MAEAYRFSRQARRPFGIAMVAVAVLGLVLLIFALDAAPLVIAVFALIVAPAIWEVARNSESRLVLDDATLGWSSGARKGEIPLDQIDEVVLSTTLDFAARARVLTKSGQKVRLPMECIPPGRDLDAELERRGVRHRRSMFGR
jgi:hypothetical protein